MAALLRIVALALAILAAATPRAEDEKLAPWPAVRWRDETPEVEVDGRWYELVAIDQSKAKEIVSFCRKTWPDRWQKRFEEDLVEALTRMGHPVGAKVDLDLVDLDSKKNVRLAGQAMTKENREKLRTARAATAEKDPKPRPDSVAPTLSRADALADLDQLEHHLREEYSYWERAKEPVERELAAARAALPATIEGDDFARRVQALLCLLGDGHTQVQDLEHSLPPGFLPFLVGDAGGRLVAFREDRGGLVDPDHPFLVALDGTPIERWLASAARLVPRGSPEFVRWHAMRQLRFITWQRGELRPSDPPPARAAALEVELADERGRTTKRTLNVATGKPVYGEWPRSRSRMLEGSIGYLRIASMDDDPPTVAALHASMAELKDARALVIDVRGNGGGSRLLLRELFPYVMRAGDPPRIANVAAYRLRPGERGDAPEGFLSDRWLFPISSREWSGDERRQLEAFARSFQPAWIPPPKQFSSWHYFALRPELPAGRERFAGPRVVLQDGGCFSATDIFLGALKGAPDVTLLGTKSGGGSGRAVGRRLEKSGVELRLSSMASFRADGSLYDGAGIEPDVAVTPLPGDFVGASDAQLDAALARLKDAPTPRK